MGQAQRQVLESEAAPLVAESSCLAEPLVSSMAAEGMLVGCFEGRQVDCIDTCQMVVLAHAAVVGHTVEWRADIEQNLMAVASACMAVPELAMRCTAHSDLDKFVVERLLYLLWAEEPHWLVEASVRSVLPVDLRERTGERTDRWVEEVAGSVVLRSATASTAAQSLA